MSHLKGFPGSICLARDLERTQGYLCRERRSNDTSFTVVKAERGSCRPLRSVAGRQGPLPWKAGLGYLVNVVGRSAGTSSSFRDPCPSVSPAAGCAGRTARAGRPWCVTRRLSSWMEGCCRYESLPLTLRAICLNTLGVRHIYEYRNLSIVVIAVSESPNCCHVGSKPVQSIRPSRSEALGHQCRRIRAIEGTK